jgi:hypothetical protein
VLSVTYVCSVFNTVVSEKCWSRAFRYCAVVQLISECLPCTALHVTWVRLIAVGDETAKAEDGLADDVVLRACVIQLTSISHGFGL